MTKKDETYCWCGLFMLIGFLFPIIMIGAFVIGSSAGEDSWGYVISHNPIAWIVVGALLFIAIMFAISESKKTKRMRNRVIILDDNALSILSYAEEFPEKWKEICDTLDKKEKQTKCS